MHNATSTSEMKEATSDSEATSDMKATSTSTSEMKAASASESHARLRSCQSRLPATSHLTAYRITHTPSTFRSALVSWQTQPLYSQSEQRK